MAPKSHLQIVNLKKGGGGGGPAKGGGRLKAVRSASSQMVFQRRVKRKEKKGIKSADGREGGGKYINK